MREQCGQARALADPIREQLRGCPAGMWGCCFLRYSGLRGSEWGVKGCDEQGTSIQVGGVGG